jgi:transposase
VTPEWLGIDEIHLAGAPRCVLTNLRQRTMLDLLRDRHRATVVAFLQRLPSRPRVDLVAMDMWRPYKEAVTAALPQATIVVDKFHVLRMANAALEVVRKEQRGRLSRRNGGDSCMTGSSYQAAARPDARRAVDAR